MLVEQQPQPNLPVYVVCPMDGEGCSQTLHRNYFLPISNNLGQAEDENAAVGVELINEPTPVPQAHSELPADGPTKSQLESLHNSLAKQSKLLNPDSAGSATPDPANDESQTGQDQPAPLRQSACTTRNLLPWRYQNFTLQ